jgi:hypothetical protein
VILHEEQRDALMAGVLNFLSQKDVKESK